MEIWKESLIKSMPKAELHLHLDGDFRVKTALELAEATNWKGFSSPLSWQEMFKRMIVTEELRSQKELLSYFEVPTLLLQSSEALRRVTRELIIDKAADNVQYCEIRWAPQIHIKEGLSVEEVIEAVLEGKQEGESKTGIKTQLIAVALRSSSLDENIALLKIFDKYQKHGIPAIDFAGFEADFIDPMVQKEYFDLAREMGFHITLHCGEVRPAVPILKRIIEDITPERVAHGAVAIYDQEICSELHEKGIMLDLCPTSNIQAGLFPNYNQYPLEQLYRMGVPVSINTDDSILSNVSLSEEYMRIMNNSTLTLNDCWNINLGAIDASFSSAEEKTKLRSSFLQWAKGIDELSLK